MNQINTILPYRSMGGWAFDDDAVGLEREPFVAGADTAIDKIVEHLGIKTDKIKMTFSKDKFPGHHVKLLYLAPDTIAVWDGGGDFYRIEDDNFNIDLSVDHATIAMVLGGKTISTNNFDGNIHEIISEDANRELIHQIRSEV